MKSHAGVAVFGALLLLAGSADAVAVARARARARASPVSKVLELLTSLEAKVQADGVAEQAASLKFQEWCGDEATEKKFEIKTAKAEIEDLSATIGKAYADNSAGSAKVEELGGGIASNEADLKAATQIREKESSEFLAAEAELMDVLDTLDRAINILERKLKGSALLQSKVSTQDISKLVQVLNTVVDAAALSLHDKKRLVALAQSSADAASDDADTAAEAELGAPAPEAYKSHSESIIDVLEDLREKSQTQLSEARREEVNAKHNYDMLRQSLVDQVAADQKEMDGAKAAMTSAAEIKATAEGDLGVAKKDLAEAEGSLELAAASCATAAADHEASQKSRAEELEALAGAKKAIAEMTSSAESLSYGGAASLLQVDGSHRRVNSGSRLLTRADLANFEVVNLVRQLAKKERSSALAQLASRIAAAVRDGAGTVEGPFAKVKAMITGMIAKLEEEAGAEAGHKAYCDKEMATTQAKIDDLTGSIDSATAKIDKKKALSVKLKGEVAELQDELAAITKSQAEMNAMRTEQSKTFVKTKADLEQGLKGMRMAMKLLRQYYTSEDAAGAAALLQQPAVPTVHSKSSGAGSSIIGMLEVIESDFGKNLAIAETDEDSAAVEYEKLSMQNKLSKATKEQDVKYKTKEAAELDKSVSELLSDKESTQTELDAVLEYSESIHSTCVTKPETYEERRSRREAEVEGLKEALRILTGEAMLMQQTKRVLRGPRL